jgi:hypothetical protein
MRRRVRPCRHRRAISATRWDAPAAAGPPATPWPFAAGCACAAARPTRAAAEGAAKAPRPGAYTRPLFSSTSAFLTQSEPQTPPDIPSHTLNNPYSTPTCTPYPILSDYVEPEKVDECMPLPASACDLRRPSSKEVGCSLLLRTNVSLLCNSPPEGRACRASTHQLNLGVRAGQALTQLCPNVCST